MPEFGIRSQDVNIYCMFRTIFSSVRRRVMNYSVPVDPTSCRLTTLLFITRLSAASISALYLHLPEHIHFGPCIPFPQYLSLYHAFNLQPAFKSLLRIS